jgi:hypothetical protein
MPGDADARVIANAIRQAELTKQHRDLTKPVPPAGTDGDSLRQVHGMEGITDEMLQERASFNLRDHLAIRSSAVAVAAKPATIDLSTMSAEELAGLEKAAKQERKNKEKQ